MMKMLINIVMRTRMKIIINMMNLLKIMKYTMVKILTKVPMKILITKILRR